MRQVGFETKVSTGERQQTHVLDRAATGTGFSSIYHQLIFQGPCIAVKTGCMEVMKQLISTFCVCFNALTD